jgi:hypothetical protein
MTRRLLRSASAPELIGPDEFISMPAVVNFLMRQPLSLCAMDEFGDFLCRINDRKKASGFERGINKVLKTLCGKSWSEYVTPEWAGRRAETVHAPALSLFGAGVADAFFASLSSADLAGGTLNRFLALISAKRSDAQDPPPRDVPDWLAKKLNALYMPNGVLGVMGGPSDPLDATRIVPTKLAWGIGAKAAWYDFEKEIIDRTDREPTLMHYIGRSAEIAIRIATIRAVGSIGGYGALVGIKDIQWAIDVVRLTGNQLAKEAGIQMVEDVVSHGEGHKRVSAIIQGAGRVKRSDLTMKVKRYILAPQLKGILGQMVEAGEIVEEREKSASGPAASFYRWPLP